MNDPRRYSHLFGHRMSHRMNARLIPPGGNVTKPGSPTRSELDEEIAELERLAQEPGVWQRREARKQQAGVHAAGHT